MFTLHWQDHTQNLAAQLRARAYADATLVAEDGHAEQVHRLVLSAASDYLAGLLKETAFCSQSCTSAVGTTLILPISGKTLEKLVHFVYSGEIELREADVEDFLETGHWLGIKGLSGGGTRGKQPLQEDGAEDTRVRPPTRSGRESRSPLSASSSIDSIPPVAATAFNIERIQTLASLLAAGAGSSANLAVGDREREHDHGGAGNGTHNTGGRRVAPPRGSGHGHHDLISAAAAAAATAADFKADVFKNSNNSEQHAHAGAVDLGTPRASSSPESAAVREFNQRLRATDPRPCPKCGKVYRSAHTLRTHLEDKHTVCPGYRCVLCGTIAKSRNSLHSHMSRQHRGISTKDLPLVEVARGGGGGGFDGAGTGAGGGGQGSAAKKERMGPGTPSFGDVIQGPNPLQAAALLKGQPTTTGSAILDTYLHFIAENSLAAAAAFGGSMSNNTGSDMDSEEEPENGFGGFRGMGMGDGEGGGD